MSTTTQCNETPVPPVVLPVDLRDYFAAKAIPMVYAQAVADFNESGVWPESWRIGVALDCYAMADAMLAARSAAT